jgi:hypothetical protein
MNQALDQLVRRRASDRCEYCRVPQLAFEFRLPIDHIVAQQHRGESVSENLALSCSHCNFQKGPNIAGLDPETRELTRLFSPRIDDWAEHFRWDGAAIIGITPIGKTTAQVLDLNDADQLELREDLLREGLLDVT